MSDTLTFFHFEKKLRCCEMIKMQSYYAVFTISQHYPVLPPKEITFQTSFLGKNLLRVILPMFLAHSIAI